MIRAAFKMLTGYRSEQSAYESKLINKLLFHGKEEMVSIDNVVLGLTAQGMTKMKK